MKRILALASFAALAVAATSYAQNTTVIAGGPHDLTNGSALRNGNNTINGQTCVFCHTPHSGVTSNPLWNRNAPTGASYQVYTSTTSDATTTGAQIALSGSGACMSCHDGTIAVDVLRNVNGLAFGPAVTFTRQGTAKATYAAAAPGASNLMNGGLPFLGTDLRNDHPVAITYEAARTATPSEFVTQALNGAKITVGATNPLPLFAPPGATGPATTANATIECASCHSSHNNTQGNFLRKSNIGSAICLSCHIK